MLDFCRVFVVVWRSLAFCSGNNHGHVQSLGVRGICGPVQVIVYRHALPLLTRTSSNPTATCVQDSMFNIREWPRKDQLRTRTTTSVSTWPIGQLDTRTVNELFVNYIVQHKYFQVWGQIIDHRSSLSPDSGDGFTHKIFNGVLSLRLVGSYIQELERLGLCNMYPSLNRPSPSSYSYFSS